MTLWIHDPDGSPTLSRREAVLNYELFAQGVAKPGDIAEVRLLPENNVSDEAGNGGAGGGAGGGGTGGGIGGENMERKRSVSKSTMGGDETEKAGPTTGKGKGRMEKRFLFVIRKLEPEQRAKPNLQVQIFRP